MKYFFSLLLLLFVGACSQQNYTASNFETIHIGHGESGKTVEYIIFSDGRVHRINYFSSSKVELVNLSKVSLKKIQKKLHKINLFEYGYHKPNDYNYFVEIRKNNKSNKIIWSNGNEEEVKPDILEFYKLVLNQITFQKKM